ncbi:MAG TPA: hypothetical protein VKR06_34230 [Ktedonosporobacter sp.]|nr:hypothetical protein [Ktedonosporobacter sp.]
MSFTQDELEAFNTILDQKLSLHRREVEQFFEERMSMIYHAWESLLEKALASQLLAMEQGISQRLPPPAARPALTAGETPSEGEGLEVQAEIAWEDLMHGIGQTLDERIASLHEAIRVMIKNMEHSLSAQLHNLHKDLLHSQTSPYNGANIQAIFASIEQLERVIESMQVATTANHALLSNRLYQHQQMAPERAHKNQQNGKTSEHDETPSANHQLPFPRMRDHEQ